MSSVSLLSLSVFLLLFCSVSALFSFSLKKLYFPLRVASKLLLIFYKETVLWNTSYTIFFSFFSSLSLWWWQCVGCECVSIVAFECCKVNAENDSLNGIIKADVGNIWMLPSLLCKAIFFSSSALHLFRESDNLSFLTFFPHFQHELRGLISFLSYNLLIGGKGKKCILFHPKRLFPGSTAVSSVSSFKDIKYEKVTTKLLPVHVLGEPQSTSFRVV